MFLTRVYLNPQRRGAAKLLGSPRAMHAAVLSSFSPDQLLKTDTGRVLWRVDGAGTPTTALYVVSPESPDLTAMCEQAGWPTRPDWQSRAYAPILDGLKSGQQWRFRLTANPTHRSRPSPEAGLKITGHVTVAHQQQWLQDKATAGGFALLPTGPDGPEVAIHSRSVRSFRREGSRVTLSIATFDGALEILDERLLRLALGQGIGRARGYGCGLMTLARQ